MKVIMHWFYDEQAKRTIKALKANRIPAFFCPNKQEGKNKILEMIPEGSSIGIGGSISLEQLGLIEAISREGITIYNPFIKGLPAEEDLLMRRKALVSDIFLTSTNAITEKGEIFNIDATGNRVGAMMFGPKRVIIVAGINKIAKNLDEAKLRVQNRAAPLNAKRLGRQTPCTHTGKCEDCESPDRICNVYLVIRKKPRLTDLRVVLIGEKLGL
jgi:hypothetical protein